MRISWPWEQDTSKEGAVHGWEFEQLSNGFIAALEKHGNMAMEFDSACVDLLVCAAVDNAPLVHDKDGIGIAHR